MSSDWYGAQGSEEFGDRCELQRLGAFLSFMIFRGLAFQSIQGLSTTQEKTKFREHQRALCIFRLLRAAEAPAPPSFSPRRLPCADSKWLMPARRGMQASDVSEDAGTSVQGSELTGLLSSLAVWLGDPWD